MATGNRYSIDTSALIQAWHNYPPMVFASLWGRIEGLASEGRLLISDEVLEELRPKDEELAKWAKSLVGSVVVSDENVQEKVRLIVGRYKNLVPPNSDKSRADPFVIAVAMVCGAIVVTEERAKGNLNGPKIPDVCRQERIRCFRFINLIKEEGWKFQ